MREIGATSMNWPRYFTLSRNNSFQNCWVIRTGCSLQSAARRCEAWVLRLIRLTDGRYGGVRSIMPDALSSARRYRGHACECRLLARLASMAETRSDYEKLANYYEQLAETELTVANASRIANAN